MRRLSRDKRALLLELLRSEARPGAVQGIPLRDGGEPAPLSFAQERLYFLDRLAPGSALYNLPFAVELRGRLQPAALAHALSGVVARHEALRTSFAEGPSGPVQVVATTCRVDLPCVDLTRVPAVSVGLAGRFAASFARRPFDLGRGPLIATALLRLAAGEHTVLVSLHHAVSDGWSNGVLIEEIAALYAASAAGRPSPLPALPCQYADFAVWQRRRLAGAPLDALLAYWRRQLAAAPASLDLPLDRMRPRTPSHAGGRRSARLPPALRRRLEELATRHGATLFMVLLAAFQALLARLSGSEDLLVGSPVAGRDRPELEPLVGLFVNLLVLRGELSGEPTFAELVERTRETTLAAFEHAELPFERLVEELAPVREPGRNPLVQTVFTLENAPRPPLRLEGLELAPIGLDAGLAKLDLTLFASEQDDGGLALVLEHDAELFDATTAQRLLHQLTALVEGAASRPELRLPRLPLLAPAERHQMVVEWNASRAAPSPRPAELLHERVLAHAAAAPDAVAVAAAEEVVTYGKLAARVGRLALRLRALGVGPEARVPVLLERSAELVTAALAVLSAGGAYLPLDPSSPPERLAGMVREAAALVVLTRRALAPALAAAGGPPLLCLDRPEELAATDAADLPPPAVAPENLAYVIYTSGSTGRPKGIDVTHRAAAHFVDCQRRSYGWVPGSRGGLIAAPAFDASVSEIWPCLSAGATLAVPDEATRTAPARLAEWLATERVGHCFLATPLAEAVLAEPAAARTALAWLLTGGDRLHRGAPPDASFRLVNQYGPAENTVVATAIEVGPGDGSPPIGRPLPGVAAYVLDRALEPLPIGVPGELAIGGAQLARGYLGRPGLTAASFVPDPFSGESGARLYRSGDLARACRDGALEWLARIDQQVKVRGVRIELGEVEAALAAHPAVAEAAVVAAAGATGARLAAFVVALRPVAVEELRRHLRERLPEAMVPVDWSLVEALPLTANRKLDRAALVARAGELAAGGRAAGEPPRTPAEELVAGIFAELLGVERVGRDDDFFALGGHSLLATQVVSRLRALFGRDLPLARLFDAPTVAGVAAAVTGPVAAKGRDGGAAEAPLAALSPRPDRLPLSFAQERLWVLDRFDPGTPTLNVPASARLRGELHVAALDAAFQAAVARHEVLRTRFPSTGGQPEQSVASRLVLPLPVVDLSRLGEAARQAALRRATAREAARSFDLAVAPLLRVTLLRLAADEHALLLTFHHIVADGWAATIFLRELVAAYAALVRGEPLRLPELPLQYADFALWQRRRLTGELLSGHLAYWREQLAGAPPGLDLPSDRPRPAIQTYRGGRLAVRWGTELAGGVRRLARGEGATPFMLLLAAFQVLLYRLTGEPDVVVGSPIAGRDRLELEGLVGMFLNSLVLRARFEGGASFRQALARVRAVALAAYAHQDLPFEKLLDELRPERDLSRTPFFQVFFNMLSFPVAELSAPGLAVETLTAPAPPSKFDLTVYAREQADGIELELVYNADLFSAERMAELARQYEAVLVQVVEDAAAPIDALTLVTREAARALPDPLAALDASWRGSVPQQFRAQAERNPEQPALVDRDTCWSYRELAERSARLARLLRRRGVSTGDVVAIYGHRSAPLVWAVLGVLEAGGAFVILDPAHPPARLADCLRLAAPRGWIAIAAAGTVDAELARCVEELCPCRLTLPPDPATAAELAAQPDRPPEVALGPEDLAYVAFTSGSTGLPKGILGKHGSLSHFVAWLAAEFGLGPGDRFSMLSGLAHDPLQRDMFTPLQLGGTIVVPDPEDLTNPARLADWLAGREVSVAHLTPAMGQVLTEALKTSPDRRLPTLRRAFFVGDILTLRDVWRLLELAPRLDCVNYYGSTETQRAVGHYRIPRPSSLDGAPGRETIPLGRGIADVQLLVLNRGGGLAGVGEAGEVVVRSPHLAKGYLGDPEGTAQKFVASPWSGRADDRVYRTGDLGRYLLDGNVELLGRADRQIKIRGFRIEPGEIEALLGRHPALREVVVVDRPGAGSERILVAYLVAEAGAAVPPAGELRAFLRERLPDYMVPHVFMPLERLPLTPNGKVDRRALPAPVRETAKTYAAPRTGVERKVAALLEELLGIERVGVEDNFFDLGGDSLQMVRFHSRLREVFQRELHMVEIFTHPTVGSLALFLGDGVADGGAPDSEEDRSAQLDVGRGRLRQQLRLRRAGAEAEKEGL